MNIIRTLNEVFVGGLVKSLIRIWFYQYRSSLGSFEIRVG